MVVVGKRCGAETLRNVQAPKEIGDHPFMMCLVQTAPLMEGTVPWWRHSKSGVIDRSPDFFVLRLERSLLCRSLRLPAGTTNQSTAVLEFPDHVCSLIRPHVAPPQYVIEAPTYAIQKLGEPHYNTNSGHSDITAEGKGGMERDEGCRPSPL